MPRSSANGQPLDNFIAVCDVVFQDWSENFGFVPAPGSLASSTSAAGALLTRAHRNGDRYVDVTGSTDWRDGAYVDVTIGKGTFDRPDRFNNFIRLSEMAPSLWRPKRSLSPGFYTLDAIDDLPVVLERARIDVERLAPDFLAGDLERLGQAEERRRLRWEKEEMKLDRNRRKRR